MDPMISSSVMNLILTLVSLAALLNALVLSVTSSYRVSTDKIYLPSAKVSKPLKCSNKAVIF